MTAVLEIARSVTRGTAPKRTLVFVATTGEEEGTLGTEWYVAHPKFPLSSMVAEMEIEMIGRADSLAGGSGKGWLTGYSRSTMGEMLKAANIPIVADPYPAQHFFERSDNIVFALMGIPAHTLSSYNLHSDCHQPSDDVNLIDGLADCGRSVFSTGTAKNGRSLRMLANGNKRPIADIGALLIP